MRIVKTSAVSAGLTTSVTTYSSGDQLGGILEFGLTGDLPGSGLVVGATLIDAGDVIGDTDLILFTTAVTPAANNAAAAFSDADLATAVGFIRLTDDVDFGGGRVVMPAATANVHLPFTHSGSLYGCLVTRSDNAVFTAVTDLTVHLFVELRGA